jgi:hypothetical protein
MRSSARYAGQCSGSMRTTGSRCPGGVGATWTTTSFRVADRPVLLDVFCMAGTELYNAILEDITEVHRAPRHGRRTVSEHCDLHAAGSNLHLKVPSAGYDRTLDKPNAPSSKALLPERPVGAIQAKGRGYRV